MANELLGDFLVVIDHRFFLRAFGSGFDQIDRQAEGNGPSHHHRITHVLSEEFGRRRRSLGRAKLIQSQLHPHAWHIDIHPGFDGVEDDSLHPGRHALTGSAEAGTKLVKLAEFFDQQGKPDKAEGIRIRRNVNLVRTEDATLGGPKNVGGGQSKRMKS